MDRTDFRKARDLVLRYGWNTTCFQIVNPGIEYWFGPSGESVVGYVNSGGVRVVVGAPVCTEADLASAAAEFESDAAEHGQSVCYFGAEGRLGTLYKRSVSHSHVLLGAQPVWKPSNWAGIVSRHSSIRAQVNRARNKHVVIREWNETKAKNNPELHACLKAWLGSKGLPPLHFVIEPETLGRLKNRRIFVAELNGEVAAFLILSPIPDRSGWLTEQFPHRPGAPNGTVELMMDAAIRRLAEDGYEYITLGLSPLSKRAKIEPFDNPMWLRILLGWMRKHGQRFYNFEGLDSFKAKMRPERWEPVFAISNEKEFSGRTMWAIANAFTENKPFRVIGGGLKKAFETEIGNGWRWLRRHLHSDANEF